jgi:hypothetical protein
MRAYSSLIAFENGSKKRVDVVVLVVVTIVLAAGPGIVFAWRTFVRSVSV